MASDSVCWQHRIAAHASLLCLCFRKQLNVDKNNMSVEARITAFILDPKPSAIAIIGRWGQGKTYFWQRVSKKTCARSHEQETLLRLRFLIRVELTC